MRIPDLRIALFTGAYNHIADGVSLTLNRLVDYLGHKGAEVRVYAPTIPQPALQHSGTLVPVRSIQAPGRPDYRVSLGLSGAARENLTSFRPDLFHIATPDFLGLAALRRATRAGTTVVASYHTHFASYLDYYRLGALEAATWRYLKWFYDQCAQVYVPTPSMLSVLKHHSVTSDLRLWPRGVESDHFNPARRSREWRRSRGISDDEVVVAFVSRLVAEKGLGVVADVARGLRHTGIGHRILIVGDGPERESLARAIPGAIFEGQLRGEALATAYASSDVFLFPSETETFGNVTLEAMSSGLPAVVADATGSNTLVQHDITGFLAPPRDSSSFLEHVTSLIRDPALRSRIGTAARNSAENYEWSRILAQIAGYYEEL
ncbi:MAG: glycosyltransferase family 4 protein [Gemmatimonadaceae bacterium]